jgi:ABC-type nitrate/sulfonate/bicarbonate transport system substrate-binding protein
MQKETALIAGYATRGQGAGPLIVTARAGLFAKYGLEVETRLLRGAKGVVQGLMDGKIQFGNLAAPGLLRANLLEKSDLVFLTGGINQQFLMGRPGVQSESQLTNGTIGFLGDDGLNDVLVQFVIAQLGKEGIPGVRPIALQEGSKDKIKNLVEKKCDAIVITPPEAIEAKRRGCHILVDFADYGLNFALGGVAARKRYVREDPVIVEKFVRAYLEGMHRYRTDRNFTVRVQQEYSKISDRSVAEETYDTTQPGMPEIPYPVPAALKVVLQIMSKELPQAATADPLEFTEERFIRELDEGGFISSLYGT